MTNYQYTKAEEDKLKNDRDAALEALQAVEARVSELNSAQRNAETSLQELVSQLAQAAVKDIPAIVREMQEYKALIPVLDDLIIREMAKLPRLEAAVKGARERYALYVNGRKAYEANRTLLQKLGWN